MTRPAHKLTVTQGNVMPEHIIFVDTETTRHKRDEKRIYHKLRLGVAIYARFRRDGKKNKKEIYRFYNEHQFWTYVESKTLSRTVLYVISHNAVFDFTILKHIKNLTKLKYRVQFVYEGGVTFISKWHKDGHSIVILDNSNWFAGKLANWGKELNLPKLTMPADIESNERWFTYCERDTNILYELSSWYFDFLKHNNLGNWKLTIASSAFNAFRHKFMQHNIYIPNETDDSDIARKSYHGGRTDVFQIGEYNDGPYYKLDTNSMYPFCMHNYEYPVCFEGRYKNPDKRKTYLCTKSKTIIADVLIHTPLPYFVYQRETRNVYPIGEFRTVLTTEEFKLAYNNGWIRHIYDVSIYRARNIFKDYVNFFFDIKTRSTRENKPLLRSFSKLYLNSLYGKFGQRGYVDRVIGNDTTNNLRISYGYNARTKERYILRQIGHQVIYSSREGESYNAFCAIASHVTANARLLLYDTIIKAKRYNCYYCDTDSIIINQDGFNRLSSIINDNKLGFWKIEGIADSIKIVAPKHYRFGDKIVMKGIKKDATQLSTNTYEQEVWPGYNTILKQGKEEYFNLLQIKTLTPNIQSGILQNNGTVRPFIIT